MVQLWAFIYYIISFDAIQLYKKQYDASKKLISNHDKEELKALELKLAENQ